MLLCDLHFLKHQKKIVFIMWYDVRGMSIILVDIPVVSGVVKLC